MILHEIKKIKNVIDTYLHLLGEDRKYLPVLWISVLITSILDVAGVGLILPLMTVVTRPEVIDEIILTKLPNELLVDLSRSQLVVIFNALFLVFFLFKSYISARLYLYTASFAYKQDTAMRLRLLSSFIFSDYDYHLENDRAKIINSLINNVNKFSSSLLALLRVLSEMIIVIFMVALLILMQPKETFMLIFVLFFILVFYYSVTKGEAKKWGDLAVRSNQQMLKLIQESIEGLKEIRILGVEDSFLNRLSNAGMKAEQSTLGLTRLSILPRYFLESGFVCIFILLIIITNQDGVDLTKLVPVIALFAVAGLRLLPSINMIVASLSVIRYSFSAVRQITQDLESTFKSRTKKRALNRIHTNSFEKLELRQVTFSYSGSKNKILSNISLAITRQQSIGIVGGSGAGKTTLIDLMLCLLHPSDGDILVNGSPLGDSVNDWWRMVAYIPQAPFLSDDTIRRNIALGIEDEFIDDSKITNAIKSAQLESFIDQLPTRENTIIGDRGIRLSGGQRQRIAIARAIYYDREVFIFDEATSALDSLTEIEIVNAIATLRKVKTMIIIAHRMSTLAHCDKILEISNGCVNERTLMSAS